METTQVSEELRRGRNLLAATVVLGHGIKHIYNSGLQAILLPAIKEGLGLSARPSSAPWPSRRTLRAG